MMRDVILERPLIVLVFVLGDERRESESSSIDEIRRSSRHFLQ